MQCSGPCSCEGLLLLCCRLGRLCKKAALLAGLLLQTPGPDEAARALLPVGRADLPDLPSLLRGIPGPAEPAPWRCGASHQRSCRSTYPLSDFACGGFFCHEGHKRRLFGKPHEPHQRLCARLTHSTKYNMK